LETAVDDEMATFKEEWEAVLDDLETESAHLLVRFYLWFSVHILLGNICFSICAVMLSNFVNINTLKIFSAVLFSSLMSLILM